MTEVQGNLWTLPAVWRCITTNGFVTARGECVMGRGCAKEAKQRWPYLPKMLGKRILAGGNVVHVFEELHLLSFPVKHNWWEPADLHLIRQSAVQLTAFADEHLGEVILLPRPGCGNGQLTWAQVKPVLAEVLASTIWTVSK